MVRRKLVSDRTLPMAETALANLRITVLEYIAWRLVEPNFTILLQTEVSSWPLKSCRKHVDWIIHSQEKSERKVLLRRTIVMGIPDSTALRFSLAGVT